MTFLLADFPYLPRYTDDYISQESERGSERQPGMDQLGQEGEALWWNRKGTGKGKSESWRQR